MLVRGRVVVQICITNKDKRFDEPCEDEHKVVER
jgi:hypothetical protein